MNRHFSKEDIRCSTSLIIRNVHQNHKEISPYLSEGLVSKPQQIISIGKYVEKTELSCTVEIVNWCSHHGKQYENSPKIQNRTAVLHSNSTSGCSLEEVQNTNTKRYMHSCAHCSTIYKSQNKFFKSIFSIL